MAHNLDGKVIIPQQYVSDYILIKACAKTAYTLSKRVIPFKTGNLANNCYHYSYTNGDTEIKLYVSNCDYAEYLQNDIPRTRGWWDECIAVFQEAFYAGLHRDAQKAKQVVKRAKKNEDKYGALFRVINLFEEADRKGITI